METKSRSGCIWERKSEGQAGIQSVFEIQLCFPVMLGTS